MMPVFNTVLAALQVSGWDLTNETIHRSSGSSMGGTPVKNPTGDDYYSILSVAVDASQSDLKSAYRTLALKWHPDVNSQKTAQDTFLKIRKAYGYPTQLTSQLIPCLQMSCRIQNQGICTIDMGQRE